MRKMKIRFAAQRLQELRSRYGETDPIIIRPDKRHAAFAKLDQDWCTFLQKHGWGKMDPVTKYLQDENGVPKQYDLTALHLLDPALKFLEGCKVTIETHTDSKVTIEPPSEIVRKRKIDFRESWTHRTR